MNTRKHRKCKQAIRDWLRPEPKGKRSGSGAVTYPDANPVPSVYRVDLNHLVNVVEHGNAADPARSRDRAGLTARRVRGRSIGRTEEANASGNSLDMPTSVWSILARELAEPARERESK